MPESQHLARRLPTTICIASNTSALPSAPRARGAALTMGPLLARVAVNGSLYASVGKLGAGGHLGLSAPVSVICAKFVPHTWRLRVFLGSGYTRVVALWLKRACGTVPPFTMWLVDLNTTVRGRP